MLLTLYITITKTQLWTINTFNIVTMLHSQLQLCYAKTKNVEMFIHYRYINNRC